MKNTDQGLADPRIDLVVSAIILHANMESQGAPVNGNTLVVLLDLLQNLLSQNGVEPPRNLERLIQRTRRRQERRRRREEVMSRHAYPVNNRQVVPASAETSGPVADEVDSSSSSTDAALRQSRGHGWPTQEQILCMLLLASGLCTSAVNRLQNDQTSTVNSTTDARGQTLDQTTPGEDAAPNGGRRNSPPQQRRLRRGLKWSQIDWDLDNDDDDQKEK
ncbi:uncharacterized protein [Macrobrachium rosenbergii]|uniref:uncharacterized protein n=1 Tax=Macrobrachium rosenbergii TaxID=79674 RepID=UPI0034D3A9AC